MASYRGPAGSAIRHPAGSGAPHLDGQGGRQPGSRQLVERGLVKRTTDPNDARARRLSLTADGLALHAEIAPLALGFEQNLLAHFKKSEIAVLKDLLMRLELAAGHLEQPKSDPETTAG